MGIKILKKNQRNMVNLWEQIFKNSGDRLEELYSIKISKGKYLEKIEKVANILNKHQSS